MEEVHRANRISVLEVQWHHSHGDEGTVKVKVKEWLSPNSLCSMITGIVRRR